MTTKNIKDLEYLFLYSELNHFKVMVKFWTEMISPVLLQTR